jgi:hypothetical protein
VGARVLHPGQRGAGVDALKALAPHVDDPVGAVLAVELAEDDLAGWQCSLEHVEHGIGRIREALEPPLGNASEGADRRRAHSIVIGRQGASLTLRP